MAKQGFNIDLSSIGMILTVVIITIVALSIIRVAVYELSVGRRIRNQASISAGEGLKFDREFIDWGILEPAENKTMNVTATITWMVPAILSIETSNWDPANASDFITLSWDYADQTVAAGQSILLNLTLHVSPEISGITDFTFDITIQADEKT